MNPDISNIDYLDLKNAVRNGLSYDGRNQWWPILSQISSIEKKINLKQYPDISGSANRLLTMSISHSHTQTKDLSLAKKHDLLIETLLASKTIECELNLYNENALFIGGLCQYISGPVLLDGIVQMIAETIPDFAICHLIVTDALDSDERHLCTTVKEYRCKLYVFKEIVKMYIPKTYAILMSLSCLQEKYLNLIFMDFFKTLLPKSVVHRIMDAYLLEGDKIMYRYGLALIIGYKKTLKRGGIYSNADEFWQNIQRNVSKNDTFTVLPKSKEYFSVNVDTKKKNNADAHDTPGIYLYDSNTGNIHENAFEVCRGFVGKITRPMNISRNKIAELMEEARGMNFKSSKFGPPYYPSFEFKGEKAVKEGSSSNSSSSNNKLHDVHNTHDTKNTQETIISTTTSKRKSKANAMATISIAKSLANSSQILTEHTASQLLALCCPNIDTKEAIPLSPPFSSPYSSPPLSPSSAYDQGLYVIFSSARDGFSLSSLYSACSQGGKKSAYPLIIIIKPLNDNNDSNNTGRNSPSVVSNQLIGIYFSEQMRGVSSKVRGNGECFLFTLSESPQDSHNDTHSSSHSSSRSSSNESTKARKFQWANANTSPDQSSGNESTIFQFAVFNSTYMSFGASLKHGTSAIRIDDDLSVCHLGPSDTYSNPDSSILGEIGEGRSEKGGGRKGEKKKREEIFFKIENVEVFIDRGSYGRFDRI